MGSCNWKRREKREESTERKREVGGRGREHFGRSNVLILEFEKERREPLEPRSFNVCFLDKIF
jgi:hypothetical protein